MKTYLDALRYELVAASERLAQPSATTTRRPRRKRSRRAVVVALAGLTISATAIAATTPWQPLFGDPGSPQPKVTGSAPPADQFAILGVLRRPQTEDDRGSVTQQALRYFGTSTQGVYTNYIRRLRSDEGDLPAILLPARSWNASRFRKDDVVCLFVGEGRASGGAKFCSTSAEIKRGAAEGSLGAVAYGLVPDTVARVEFHYGNVTQSVAVHDNFYEYRAPEQLVSGGGITPSRPTSTSWLDAQGNPTSQQPQAF
jgi:hypothetical protein